MKRSATDQLEKALKVLRRAISEMPTDVSHDATGSRAPKPHEIFAPAKHAATLDPRNGVVLGARGTGKSFWAGVLLDDETREIAALAYPRLGLDDLRVASGYSGLGGLDGVGREALDACLPLNADEQDARTFWWATILQALDGEPPSTKRLRSMYTKGHSWQDVEEMLNKHELRNRRSSKTVLVVYDALDTVATTWPRRRLLTQALLEVSWASRAYRTIRIKLFLRPDQLEDDALQFVELPKIRTGAVRLEWSAADLYGAFFARLALGEQSTKKAIATILKHLGLPRYTQNDDIFSRRWPLTWEADGQAKLLAALAGKYMGQGEYAYKKGAIYSWVTKHLADAYNEVTPRSFFRLFIGAAQHGAPPPGRALAPKGIQHGLREASKLRVDQLHQEFPWIKGVIAPMAGLLLPKDEAEVFGIWENAGTVRAVMNDAMKKGYLSPFPSQSDATEAGLYRALESIGVMSRRPDGRIDMPDLFRVASRLLKKGATPPG